MGDPQAFGWWENKFDAVLLMTEHINKHSCFRAGVCLLYTKDLTFTQNTPHVGPTNKNAREMKDANVYRGICTPHAPNGCTPNIQERAAGENESEMRFVLVFLSGGQ